MNKKHWNTVEIENGIPEPEIRKMIDHSYDLVVKRLLRRTSINRARLSLTSDERLETKARGPVRARRQPTGRIRRWAAIADLSLPFMTGRGFRSHRTEAGARRGRRSENCRPRP
jgi:hypothetical protein